MKNYKYIILAIITIVSFLYVQISYNGTPSISIFTCLITLIYRSLGNGWDFSVDNFQGNYTYYLVEFLLISIFILIVSKLKKHKLIFLGLVLYVFMWIIWLYMLNSLIEVNLYIKTSIPFLISILITNVMIVYDNKKPRKL
ncbi:hypothetical protein [Flavobacterium sp.]|uniref:hypothetical protein n=1 Tax=Flavobacterium sp. TaxID=239 RepID=UPI00286B12C2|nr:hypothetical protein [Flavobacterium sp.]